MYPKDFPDLERFEVEFNLFKLGVARNEIYHDLESLEDVTKAMVKCGQHKPEFYPNVYKLYVLLLTSPVSTATNERAFSALKIIKGRLRTSLLDPNLNNQIILYVNKDLTVDINGVIDVFATSSVVRRVNFILSSFIFKKKTFRLQNLPIKRSFEV